MTGARSNSFLVAAAVLLALAGAWFSGDLVRRHADPARAGLLTRLCEAVSASGAGCAATLNGPFSEITVPVPAPTRRLGISVHRVTVPVAFLALSYFVFIGIWFAMLGGPRPRGQPWHRLPRHLTGCGVATSLVYLGLMAFGASGWCVGCAAVHMTNFLMAMAVWRLTAGSPAEAEPGGGPEEIARRMLTTRQALSTIGVALAVVAGLWFHRHEKLLHRDERHRLLPYQAMVTSMQRDPELLLREFYAQPDHELPFRPTEHAAEHRLVVFTDFECPACYCHATSAQQLLAELFEGRLNVHVRHFPLDGHPGANRAARAAEAARLEGGEKAFGRMHDLLFENRDRLDDEDTYRDLARELGLDADRLLRRMDGDEVLAIVAVDAKLADDLDVNGTPALFLDGRRVPELCRDSAAFWRAYAGLTAPPAQHHLATP